MRHWLKNHNTESEISPVGGIMNPATASATPTVSIAMADHTWKFVRASFVIGVVRFGGYGGCGFIRLWGFLFSNLLISAA